MGGQLRSKAPLCWLKEPTSLSRTRRVAPSATALRRRFSFLSILPLPRNLLPPTQYLRSTQLLCTMHLPDRRREGRRRSHETIALAMKVFWPTTPARPPAPSVRRSSAKCCSRTIRSSADSTLPQPKPGSKPVSYTHLRAHETRHDLVCRLLLEKK